MKAQFGICSSPQAPPKSAVQIAIEAAQMQLVYGPASGGIQHSGDPVPLSLDEIETLWHLLSRFYHTETDAPDCTLDVRRAVAKVRMRESGALPGDRCFTIHTGNADLSGDAVDATPFTNPARSARYDTVGSHRYRWVSPDDSGTGTLEDMDRISALEQVNDWNQTQGEPHSYPSRTYWLLPPQ